MSPKCSYITILCFWANPLRSSHMQLWMSDCSFAPCSQYPPKWFAALFHCYMAGITWNCCHLSATSVYTTQPCTSLQCHFIQSHIHKMQVCLAVTCHCTFYRMIRICYVLPQQHGVGMDTAIRVSTENLILEKKNSPATPDLNPRPFDHKSVTLPLSCPNSQPFLQCNKLKWFRSSHKLKMISYCFQHFLEPGPGWVKPRVVDIVYVLSGHFGHWKDSCWEVDHVVQSTPWPSRYTHRQQANNNIIIILIYFV